MSDTDRDIRPVFLFLLGLLSVLSCSLLGPVTLSMSRRYLRDRIVEGKDPHPLATTGRILGLVGVAILVLQVVLLAIWLIVFLFIQGRS